MDLVIRSASIAGRRGTTVDIGIDDGRIVALEPALAAEAWEIDIGRRLAARYGDTHQLPSDFRHMVPTMRSRWPFMRTLCSTSRHSWPAVFKNTEITRIFSLSDTTPSVGWIASGLLRKASCTDIVAG